MSYQRMFRFTGPLMSVIVLAGCSGFRSVERVTIDGAPYIHFSKTLPFTSGSSLALLPVTIDQEVRDAHLRSLLGPVAEEANGFLGTNPWFKPVDGVPGPWDEGPVVYAGTEENGELEFPGAPKEEGYISPEQNIIAFREPSEEWKERVRAKMQEVGAEGAVVLSISRSEFYIRTKNWKGAKELPLGYAHTVQLPWLTSLGQPIEVLYVVGAVLDRNGEVLRVGAEGLLAASSASLIESAFGIQRTIRDDQVQSLLTDHRRTDIEGAPLVLHASLQNLCAQLAERVKLVRPAMQK